MDIVRVFGTNLKRYRTEKRLSQEKFAEMVDADIETTGITFFLTNNIDFIKDLESSYLFRNFFILITF